MRLVLDTNVLLAAILADGLCRDLVRKRIKPHEIFTSRHLLDELAKKLRYKFGQDPKDVPFFVAYQTRVTLIPATHLPQRVSRDPDDDHVLAAAIAAHAEIIITGDQDLLILGKYSNIRILSPRRFLELLDRKV